MVLQWQGRIAWLPPRLSSHVGWRMFHHSLTCCRGDMTCVKVDFIIYRLPNYMYIKPLSPSWDFDSDLSLLHHQYVIEMKLYNIMLWLFPVKTVLCYRKIVLNYINMVLYFELVIYYIKMVINSLIVFKGAFKTTNDTNTRRHFDCSL